MDPKQDRSESEQEWELSDRELDFGGSCDVLLGCLAFTVPWRD
jgi:hypothetical protein